MDKVVTQQIIEPQTGTAFVLKKDQILTVTDVKGSQVSDMVCFSEHDLNEKISSGKTLDYEETTHITRCNHIWSNRSRRMIKIINDTNGQNDFLLAPCCPKTFEIMYNNHEEHPSCLMNLYKNLSPYGIELDDIPNAFNIFMNVRVDSSGKISVDKPQSIAGDKISFLALMDLVVGLTACSAEDSNGGTFKPIQFEIEDREKDRVI